MQPLLLWNNTRYAQTLSGFFGEDFVITDSEAFQAASGNWEKYSSLLVLCELNWTLKAATVNKQDLYGIELIKELRRTQNLNLPVLFVSFLSPADILNAEREIFTAIGHDFYRLPALPGDFKSFIQNEFITNGIPRKLSVMELNDIKSFYCSKEGILSHELHYLNRYLNFDITVLNHESVNSELLTSIKKIHELFQLDAGTAIASFQVQFPELNKANISEAVNYIIRTGNTLRNKYGLKPATTRENDEIFEPYKWSVLLLDDEINESHNLVQCLKRNNVNIICCNNAASAFSVLQKDWAGPNSIMVIVADYRLYEQRCGIKRHQKIQGYQFLKEIAASDHLVRLVAFSGLQRKFLLNSFKHYNIRTEVKSKIDYLSDDHTNQLFCDELIEMAEENWEAIEALPSKCAGFEKSLKDTYREFRMHPDYDKMEGNISLTAKEYIREIQQQIADGEEIRIGAIENIKSPLAKTKKDIEAHFKRFQNYLIARRIALWLYASNKKGVLVNIDSRKIAEILTDQKYPTDAYRQVLSTNLGLSLDDFPKNITIEERRWLQYEMQINIFRDISFIDPVFSRISNIYKDFILKDEQLGKKISSNKFVLSARYKQGNYFITFDKQFLPELKTHTDVRVLFHIIKEHKGKKPESLDILKVLISKIRFELLKGIKEVLYLKNLCEYFNAIYRQMNNEKSVIINPAQKIKAKSEFENKTQSAINNVFEKVYQMLLSGEIPAANESADIFSVYACGIDIFESMGSLNELNKAAFFTKLIEQINLLYLSYTKSFDESRKSNRNKANDEEAFEDVYGEKEEGETIGISDDFAFDFD